MDKKELIPSKEYSLHQLMKLGVFPWVKSYNSYLKLVLTEKRKLGVKILGDGHGTTYRIRGEKIIKYLNERYEKSQEDGNQADQSQDGGGEASEPAGKKRAKQKADVGRRVKAPRKSGE
jgi:hypothetical protein